MSNQWGYVSVVPAVRVNEEAHELWTDFARSQGVTVAGLLEAAAMALPKPGDQLDPRWGAVIEQARAIDVDNRRRG